MTKDGRHYRRIVEGFKRVFAATIFFRSEEHPAAHSVIDWARFHFFDSMKLWFNAEDHKSASEGRPHDNAIVLSQALRSVNTASRWKVRSSLLANIN